MDIKRGTVHQLDANRRCSIICIREQVTLTLFKVDGIELKMASSQCSVMYP